MIQGSVNAFHEAVIPLTIRDVNGHEHLMHAVVDTGFTGNVSLSGATIQMLGLTPVGQVDALLADGSRIRLDVYRTTVIWHGAPRTVDVDCVEGTAMVGMMLLEGSDLHIRHQTGGKVVIEAVP